MNVALPAAPPASKPTTIPASLHDLLLRCCDTEGTRYNLSEPFVIAGWRYFTDGKIAARVPAPGEPDTEGRKLPRMAELFDREDFLLHGSDAWIPWPRFDYCKECEGVGRLSLRCPTCNGTGQHTCPCGFCEDAHACGKCKGSGKQLSQSACYDCANTGRSLYSPSCEIYATLCYAQLLCQLPGCEYITPRSTENAILFIFDGGQGLLMPRVKE